MYFTQVTISVILTAIDMGLARHKVFQGNAGMSWFLTKEYPNEYPGKTLRIRLRSTEIQLSPHTTIKKGEKCNCWLPNEYNTGFLTDGCPSIYWSCPPELNVSEWEATSLFGTKASKSFNGANSFLIKSLALSFSLRKSKGGYFKNPSLCTFIKTTLIQNGFLPDELFHQFPQEQ